MIVTFAHAKGGVGKTLLSFNYAVYLNKKYDNVEVLDLDGQKSITLFNRIRESNNFKKLNIANIDTGIRKNVIDYLADSEDKIVVVDTGGFDSSNNRIAISLADLIITPVSASPTETLRLLDYSENILKEIARDMKKDIITNVVFNGVHHALKDRSSLIQVYKNCSNLCFMQTIIRNRVLIEGSVANGSSVLENKKDDANAVAEMKSLFKEIEQLLAEQDLYYK